MSLENVELVRGSFEAYLRGDLEKSFRDGRAVSLRDYATKEEALEAVGLRK